MSYSLKKKDRSSYSNQEKLELTVFVVKMKDEYDLEVEKKRENKIWLQKKRQAPITPSTGFIAKAVGQFFGSLKYA